MIERRIFPRIETDWPLIVITDDGQKQVGHVNNISMSGALLIFSKIYDLDPEKHTFTIRLKNQHLDPSELALKGLKKWTTVKKNEIILSISFEKVHREKKTQFTHFLSRSDKLHVEAMLLISE
ncbi:MAG TPA: hypothetical protein ENI15_19175 [Spirochaetes bacterium]|nr:hypothetical protein [Spirochaetota bacterium]